MTTWGWCFFIGSNGLVITLTIFCFVRILTEPAPEEHMHAPLDVNTGDIEEN